MGLAVDSEDNTVELWHSAYSGFRRFRMRIAELLKFKEYLKDWPMPGMTPEMMEQYATMFPGQKKANFTTTEKLDAEMAEFEKKIPGIRALMYHSDCEGVWTHQECSQIVTILAGLIFKIPKAWEWEHSYFEEQLTKLIRGLVYCRNKKQKAIFH